MLDQNKKRLKAILKQMLKLADQGNLDEIRKINSGTFIPLYRQVFGDSGLTKESEPYDRARNNIINMFTDPMTPKQKQKFRDLAKKYIAMIN